MTKEDWFQIRTQTEIPITVFFEFYREKGGYVDNLSVFTEMFFKLVGHPVFLPSGKIINLNYAEIIRNVFCYFNIKFDEKI